MLSTNLRLRLEAVAKKMRMGESVELSEMIWAEKLAKANGHAAAIMRRARRELLTGDVVEGSMDDFLNKMDLGDPDPSNHKTKFDSVDEIVDWFKRDESDDWRQRD